MQQVYFSTNSEDDVQLLGFPKDGAWVHIQAPSNRELSDLCAEFDLDQDMVLDGVDPNEAPRLDSWNKDQYIYMRYCLPEISLSTTATILLILKPKLIITICAENQGFVESFTSSKRELATNQKSKMVLQILDEIVAGYRSRINAITKQTWKLRKELNKAHIENKDFVNIIDVEEDLNDFLEALEPMGSVLNTLMAGKTMTLYEEDSDLIEDLALSISELITLAESRLKTLTNIREAYATISANNLNKVFKLMTSITILMSIFTIITGIYSMNIALPGAHTSSIFWIIIGLAAVLIGGLALTFKRKRWL